MQPEKADRNNVDISAGELGIYIITYNRAFKLEATLNYILNSAICHFPITVLDNCSTDNTFEVVTKYTCRFDNLEIIKNKVNVGLGANFLKVFDYSDYNYTWILCDDDKIEAVAFDDVMDVIQEGKIDLIHVGAHAQKEWPFGGRFFTPRELLKNKYPYFKFSSFIPCNIFKTNAFTKFMLPGYGNIVNAYPHMPFLFDLYKTDGKVYVAKNPIIVAQPSDSGYTHTQWFSWWMKTCELLGNKEDVRLAYLDQYKDIGSVDITSGLESFLYAEKLLNDGGYVAYFIDKYMTLSDKVELMRLRYGPTALRNKLYWFRVRAMNYLTSKK